MSGERPRVSIVIPAYNEDEQIVPILDRLFESVRLACEVLVVVDTPADTTIGVVEGYAVKEPRLHCLVNTYGPGPANAIRFGIDAAAAPVTVVTMADGCDDARQIDELARLVERGVAVAAASRYMAGGQQVEIVARRFVVFRRGRRLQEQIGGEIRAQVAGDVPVELRLGVPAVGLGSGRVAGFHLAAVPNQVVQEAGVAPAMAVVPGIDPDDSAR